MAWQGIEGHDDVLELFRRALARGRLASTFLFVGPAGVGKRRFANALAKSLLCQTRDPVLLDPCRRCPACVQVEAGTHPDLAVVEKPAGKRDIPVAALVGDPDRRRQEGLCHAIALRPFMGGRRVAIIDDADALNQEGANCLLKTLEEPPPRSVLILIGTSADKQLPTIRSRAQIIRFRPLAAEIVQRLLLAGESPPDPEVANQAAAASEGSLARAAELADPGLWEFREQLLDQLGAAAMDSVELSKAVLAFVEEAGTEAPLRRARARLLVGFAAGYFRQIVRALAGGGNGDQPESDPRMQGVLARWTGQEDRAAAAVERCLEALSHIDRNANQTILLESWLHDMAPLAPQS